MLYAAEHNGSLQTDESELRGEVAGRVASFGDASRRTSKEKAGVSALQEQFAGQFAEQRPHAQFAEQLPQLASPRAFSSLKAKAEKTVVEQAEAAALAFLFGHERYEYYASDPPGPAGAPEEAPAPAESMSRAPPPAAAGAAARFLSDSFQCPLTMEVMRDPVMTTDGQTYERMEIERWFALGNRTSPLTGAELPCTLLFPNIALRNAIQDAAGA
jgi:hypothetical protein